MAGKAIYDWSTSAADNGTADASLTQAEGMAAGVVNNSSRQEMAREAAFIALLGGNTSLVTYGGTGNAYTVASPSGHAFSAFPTGLIFTFIPNATNTGAATLALDGMTAKDIKLPNGDACPSGALVSGVAYLLRYTGTEFRIIAGALGSGASGVYQPASANLTEFATVDPSADGLSFVSAADYAAMRTLLSLGTAALTTIGTSGDTVPKNNTNNTQSGTIDFTGSAWNRTSSDGKINLNGTTHADTLVIYQDTTNEFVVEVTDTATPANKRDLNLLKYGGVLKAGGSAVATEARANTFASTITGSAFTGLDLTYQSGVQGGSFRINRPASGTSIAGPIVFDVYTNELRIYEGASPFRGVLLNITGCGSQSALFHSGNLSGTGMVWTVPQRISAADGNTVLLVNGATKGIRFRIGSAGAFLDGVDNTGVASYQPMGIGGSIVYFHVNGSDVALVDSTGVKTSGGIPYNQAGKQAIPIPASSMTPRTTNGPAPGLSELGNGIMRSTLDYDGTTQEFAQFSMAMPKGWNESTISAQFGWTADSGSGGVQWGIRAVAISDDDALNANFGSGQVVNDTLTATGDLMVTAETEAVTIAGLPSEGDLVYFEVYRVPADAADTLNGIDAKLVFVRLFITTNAANDA